MINLDRKNVEGFHAGFMIAGEVCSGKLPFDPSTKQGPRFFTHLLALFLPGNIHLHLRALVPGPDTGGVAILS